MKIYCRSEFIYSFILLYWVSKWSSCWYAILSQWLMVQVQKEEPQSPKCRKRYLVPSEIVDGKVTKHDADYITLSCTNGWKKTLTLKAYSNVLLQLSSALTFVNFIKSNKQLTQWFSTRWQATLWEVISNLRTGITTVKECIMMKIFSGWWFIT